MAKAKKKTRTANEPRAKDIKKVKASAIASCFQIEVRATIKNSGSLSNEEMEKVKSEFKHILNIHIPKLPYAHVYPFEVQVT